MYSYSQDEKKRLAAYLATFLTPERLNRFREVLSWRTGHLQIVLVDLHLQHNASAVVRTCDAIGIQHLHVVETYNPFLADPDVSMGSQKWVTQHEYTGASALENCVNTLHDQGLLVAAATMSPTSRPLLDLPVEQPVALMFGNERKGLSEQALQLADCHVHVPMYGFVESYNVSVAAALAIQILKSRLHSSDVDWHLPLTEQAELNLLWMQRSLKKIRAIEKLFRKSVLNGTCES